MHSATLDTAAVILLLSSVGSMGLLVKRTPKSRLASSTSVLSASDILSSILTALMVLFHHFYMNDGQRTMENRGYQFGENSTEFLESEDGTKEKDCDLKSVFYQYAVFFVPFINAFLSLLNFSLNCYSTTREVDKRCCELICGQYDAEKNVEKVSDEEKEAQTKLAGFRASSSRGSKVYSGFRHRYKELALLSQWLLPALFTGMFHLGERRALELAPQKSEDLVCLVAANFPFENCAAEETELEDKIWLQDYLSSEDNLLWPSSNSSEVDDVIRLVYGVVQAALNDSTNPSDSEGYFNETQLLDTETNPYATAEIRLESKIFMRRMNEYYKRDGSGDKFYSTIGAMPLNSNEKVTNNLKVADCMKRRCVVPVRFLKIYLFILLVLVYFAPILLSSLLLVVSYYKCREAARKIRDTKALEDKALQNVEEEAAKDEESSKEGWFAPQTDPGEEMVPAAEQSQEEAKKASENRAKMEEVCALACETDKVQGFFRIFKANAAVAVILWTPLFFQIISKVFFCSQVPSWVTEVSFLATMAFAVFRNAVNLNIVKMETETENYKKRNSIHPNS